MSKKSAKIAACLRPMPSAVVSCRDINGEENALVVGYCCNCSFKPPMVMVGIVPSRYSHHMIKNSGCFVVNLPTLANKEVVDYMGSHSRRDGDKLLACNVNTAPGEKVAAPVLTDFPISIECTVVDSIMTGSHEMFVGKIEYVHADEELLKEDGSIDFAKVELL